MKLLHKIGSFIITLLGIIHCSFTPVFYNELTEPAIWYAGTGVGLIVLGLNNMNASMENSRLSWWLCLIANLLGITLSILILSVVKEIQAFISIIAIGLVTVAHIWIRFAPVTPVDTISCAKNCGRRFQSAEKQR